MQKRWLTIKDFEEEFGVASSTQAKMRRDKVLPYSKLGGFVFYDRNAIDKVLENHTIGAIR